MSMMTTGFVDAAPVGSSDNGVTVANRQKRPGTRSHVKQQTERPVVPDLLTQKEKAKQQEYESTFALIADFEARLKDLDENPPAELSPVKRFAYRESLEHTLQTLRRQITPRKPLERMKGY